MEICVQEVYQGASAVKEGKSSRQKVEQLLWTPEAIPWGTLKLGHSFRDVPNQGKGHGLGST